MNIEPVNLNVDGVNIAGQLYLPDGDGPFPSVCTCHGLPAGPPDPTDRGYATLAEKICPHGFAVLIFNFRGAGDSGGNLDMTGWVRDLKAVIDHLYSLQAVDRSYLALLGFSAGAAVSVYVAAGAERVTAVAACACPDEFTLSGRFDGAQSMAEHFHSIGAIRDNDFPASAEDWFHGFEQVKPIDCIGRISPRPLLLVNGSLDDVVEVFRARRLYARAGQPKELAIVEGAGHRLRRDEQAMAIVIDWLKALTLPRL